MFKLWKEIFRTGEATLKYPFAPYETCKDFRGKPEHKAEQCIACAACAIACPPNAIHMENDVAAGTRTWEISYGRCIFCGRCEETCPTGAIRLSRDFELAVTRKEDMTRRAVFTLAECPSCGKPFAPAKEVAYVAMLLEAQGAAPEAASRIRLLAATCPDCKRKYDVQRVTALGIERHMEARS